jgi:NDP-sugar pyrophosphorylase family protein
MRMTVQTAIILAAGKGSRLHPITLERSKAMLPILGKPMVERVMEDLVANGVSDFILVVSPDDRHITRYFRRESTLTAEIRFVYQPERRGMANALQCAVPLINGPFLLSACDNLISAEHIQRMLTAWEGQPAPEGLLSLMPVEPDRLGSVGIVVMDGPWVRRIIEKPNPAEAPSNLSSLPLYLFSQRLLDYLPEVPLSPRGEYELQDAIQLLIDRTGRVGGVMADKRLTLTSSADLLAINHHYLTNGADQTQLSPRRVGPNTRLITPLFIESGTVIGADCQIGPNVYIERDCQIGDRVRLQNAVVLREAVLPPGVSIDQQVVS